MISPCNNPLADLVTDGARLGICVEYGRIPLDYHNASRAVRAMAIQILRRHQIVVNEIARLPSGAPLWPEGWAGSITHSMGVGAVAIAKKNAVKTVGIDVEHISRMHDDAWPHVLTKRELLQAQMLSVVKAKEYVVTCFSAKEALFKAISPLNVDPPGFHEVEVHFPMNQIHFTFPFHDILVEDFSGLFRIGEGMVACLVLSRPSAINNQTN
ncbi:MAG: 4'-phosphopantetheinyl transferase superfamily protein [Verrucomicrobiota bacterium]